MEKELKKWSRPKLTVLVREEKQQAVLTGCKAGWWESGGVMATWGAVGCHDDTVQCASLTPS